MILLVDIGNTRVKWATFDGQDLGAQVALAHENLVHDQLVGALTVVSTPKRILVSNVGGTRNADLIRTAARELWNVQPEFIESTASAAGVRNAYPESKKLGVDRWLAVIAAHGLEKRAACIVSVGTAMTIDAVDRGGQHLGGVIVPGPDLMISSLLHNTSEIARRAEQGSVGEGVFADNTLGAIRQGSLHALAALVERAMVALQTQVGESPALLLTGGASRQFEGLIDRPRQFIPDLVLRGLAILAGAGDS
ncbi:MAG TPA: type III pantothenate kinase [Steroidobacteraceae bacterium]|jgi:type III pantothenate kinase